MSSRNEKKLQSFLAQSISGVTPGVRVRAYLQGRKKIDVGVGQIYWRYDLASLTKIFFTTTALMTFATNLDRRAQFRGKLMASRELLESPIQNFLPWFPHKTIRIEQLLYHHSGLNWWEPYFKKMNLAKPREQRWKKLETFLKKSKRTRARKAVYSDLDFFTLGFLLETLFDRDLLSIWKYLANSFEFEDLEFHENNRTPHPKSDYAPTENCKWRKKILQGEVHDENAWALGGVAPHAGLFGTMDAVTQWALWMREIYFSDTGSDSNSTYASKRRCRHLIEPKLLRHWTRRATPQNVGDWGLGFMKPTADKTRAGMRMSAHSFGHTGFTGTSFWMDPKTDLLLIVLSNRIHPTRDNRQFVQLRPKIYDFVAQALLP